MLVVARYLGMATNTSSSRSHFSVPRTLHGALDYLMGILVATSPWLFGFSTQHMAPQIATTIGFILIGVSLVTNYEAGVIHLLPFAAHRFTDFLVGIALLGATWHFSLGGRAGIVFTVLGAIQLAITALTRRPRETTTSLS
jgi:hypothetical protein